MIMNQFFTKENFEKFMSSNKSSFMDIESDAIIKSINFDNVFSKLKAGIVESPFGGMLGMMGGEAALDPLKPIFEVKFKEIIHDMFNDDKFIQNITKKSENSAVLGDSIESMVDARLDELTPKMVKDIIQEMIREHLGWLVVWGGVFGALIGFATTLF